MMPEKRLDVILIGGGGPAGLVTLKELLASGFNRIAAFESRDCIGGIFSQPWLSNEFRLQTRKQSSCLFDAPFPKSCESYPSKQDVLNYLEAEVKRYNLKRYIHFNERVLNCVYLGGARPWQVKTDSGLYHTERLIVSNGRFSKPHWPKPVQGESFFPKADRIHSAQYSILQDDDIRGRRLLFVGFGNTAETLIKNAVQRGAKVFISQRGGITVNPYYLLYHHGRGYFPISLLCDLLRPFCLVGGRFGRKMCDYFAHLIQSLYYSDLEQYGFSKNKIGPFSKNYDSKDSRIPVIEQGLVTLFRQGLIPRAFPEILKIYRNKRLKFVDGRQVQVDKIIYSTGFKPNLDFLPEGVRSSLLKEGLPEKSTCSYWGNSLFFVGMHYDLFGGLGRTLPREAKKLAKLIKIRPILPIRKILYQKDDGENLGYLGSYC